MCKEMDKDNCRLYVGSEHHYFATFDAAKLAAQEYMPNEPELRIVILIETTGADFWAYEYQSKQWVPS
jgi:hypothetical protein